MSLEVRRFSGEEERPVQRRCEFALNIASTKGNVAVGSARVRIGLPIVRVCGDKFGAAAIERNVQDAR
jgi:hypothetical protein